jgi:ABC-type Zn uptake system ZnuABC Zn-binding protein ZnuA
MRIALLFRLCLLLGCALTALAARADTQVLTAHPATQAITEVLVKGTSIKATPVASLKLPASRLYSYLNGRGKRTLTQLASQSEAVITLNGLWPEDPIYPHSRRINLRIVPIDATQPMDQALAGIALLTPDNDPDLYAQFQLEPMPANGEQSAPWLSPTALGRMADVIARDLSALVPEAADTLQSNLGSLKHQLMQQKAETDLALANADSLATVALGPHFGYLASDLGLELVGTLTAATREWDASRLETLSRWLTDQEIEVVLLEPRFAEPAIIQAIEQGGATPVVITLPDETHQDPIEWTHDNLSRLAGAYPAL